MNSDVKIRRQIVLEPDGSFPNPNAQIYYVTKYHEVSLVLSSPLLVDFTPILLMDSVTSKYGEDIVKKGCIYDKATFNPKILVLEPTKNDNDELHWVLEFNHGRSQCVQIAFILHEEAAILFTKNEGESTKFTIRELGKPDYLVIRREAGESDGFRLITLVARCLGPLDRWEKIIQQLVERGYNAFHLTPLNEPGESGNPYIFKNPLVLDPFYFVEGTKVLLTLHFIVIMIPATKVEDRIVLLRNTIKELSVKHKIKFFCDVILNTTSINADWIGVGDVLYTPDNTPHLCSALILDDALSNLNERIVTLTEPHYPKRAYMKSINDVNDIVNLVRHDLIPPLNLPSYYQYDIDKILTEIRSFLVSNKFQMSFSEDEGEEFDFEEEYNIFRKDKIQTLVELLDTLTYNEGATIFGTKVKIPQFISCIKNYLHDKLNPLGSIRRALERLNSRNYARLQDIIITAIDNIQNEIVTNRLDANRHEFNLNDNPLVDPYFASVQEISNGRIRRAAHAGWISTGDKERNPAMSATHHYLRRSLVIWRDALALRYSESPGECSSYLLDIMTQYIQMICSIFHGFRLVNEHATPLWVSRYFINKAREISENVFVFASRESSVSSAILLELDGIVNEAINPLTPGELSNSLICNSHVNNHVLIGRLDYLHPQPPIPIFFDLTHDNPSYASRRTFRDTLPSMALLCFSQNFVGTTMGFDEFYPENPNVITEKRYYGLNEEPQQISTNAKNLSIHFYIEVNPRSNKVELSGSWDGWKNFISMRKLEKHNNVFSTCFHLPEGNYEYKYRVDNHEWQLDSARPKNDERTANILIVDTGTAPICYLNCIPIRRTLNSLHQELVTDYNFLEIKNYNFEVTVVHRAHNKLKESVVLISRSEFHPSNESDYINLEVQLPGYLAKVVGIYWVMDTLGEEKRQPEYLQGETCEVIQERDLSNFCAITTKYSPDVYISVKFFVATV